MGTRWHPEHPLWLQWKSESARGVVHDTRDGSLGGIKNDKFLGIKAD
jgi:hypothetical protein